MTIPPHSRVDQASRLIGRDDELRTLESMLPRHGEPGLRTGRLVGEPGIGKTALLHELGRRATARGLVAIRACGTPWAADRPLGLFRTSSWPLPDEEASSRDWSRYRLWDQACAALEAAAGDRGAVVLVDDAHWADPAAVELMAHLCRRDSSHPLSLIVAHRPNRLAHELEMALDASGRGQVLGVSPLTEEGARLLVDLPDDVASAAFTASRGNPLYLLAVAASGTTPLDRLGSTVTHRLALEVEHLPAVPLLVARGAAVLGEPVDVGLLASVLEMDADTLAAALDELIRLDVMVSGASGIGFRHPLLAEAAYRNAGPGWSRSLHARTARALARLGAPATEQAPHLWHAVTVGDADAAATLEAAADSLVWRAPQTALRSYDAALRAAVDPAHRRHLGISRARALVLVGKLADASRELHGVLSQDEDADRTETIVLLAMTQHLLGRHEEAVALLEGELAAGRSSEETRIDLTIELAAARLMQGDWERARLDAESCLAAHATLPRSAAAAVTGILALTTYAAGATSRAGTHARHGAAMVDAATDDELSRHPSSLVWLGWAEMFLSRYPASLRHQERAAGLARTNGTAHLLPYVLIGLHSTHRWLGHLEAARDAAVEAQSVARITGSTHQACMAEVMLCRAHTWLGDSDRAISSGERAVELGRDRTDWSAALAGAVLGQARLEAGNADGVVALVTASGGGAGLPNFDQASRPDWYCVLTRASLATGDRDGARAWAGRAVADAEAVQLPNALGFAGLAEAHVRLADGFPTEAAVAARSAVDTLTSCGNVLDAARARLSLADALVSCGDRVAALDELLQADVTFTECGAERLRQQAVREMRRLGRRVPNQRRSTPAAGSDRFGDLTPRESEVAHLVAEGLTNRAIAGRLFLSEKTVERHVGHVLGKLRLTNRAALAAVMALHGGDA